MSVSHEKLLLLKSATVNKVLGFDDVCKEKYVVVAYNNLWPIFIVSRTGETLIKYPPVHPFVRHRSIAWDWEIQAAFFYYNNIKPIWINANFNWGTLNYTTGQWSGAVGLVQRDKADYAIPNFAGTHPRSEVAAFSPGISYKPLHWLTIYPQELSPMWNLLGLFTKVYNSQMSKLNLIIKTRRSILGSDSMTKSDCSISLRLLFKYSTCSQKRFFI